MQKRNLVAELPISEEENNFGTGSTALDLKIKVLHETHSQATEKKSLLLHYPSGAAATRTLQDANRLAVKVRIDAIEADPLRARRRSSMMHECTTIKCRFKFIFLLR